MCVELFKVTAQRPDITGDGSRWGFCHQKRTGTHEAFTTHARRRVHLCSVAVVRMLDSGSIERLRRAKHRRSPGGCTSPSADHDHVGPNHLCSEHN
ncbi:MAG TPA: hypothetical protein PLV93_07385, partial [Microthrixaceae bacterium]|nr:hypothetical protein [Microthrixaceae bacterium]